MKGDTEMSRIASGIWMFEMTDEPRKLLGRQTEAKALMAQPLHQQATKATLPDISAQSTVNVFTGKPCACGHGGWCNCSSPAAQRALPYLAVPGSGGMTFEECQASLATLAASRPVRTEVEILRERLAAMEAQIAALTPPEPSSVANPMARAVSRWPGSQGFIQGIRWRGSL